MHAKYIVIRTKAPGGEREMEIPLMFPHILIHKDFAETARFNERLRRGKVVSAGFVSISEGKLHCFGESESLNIKSRPKEDSDLFNRQSESWGSVYV